MLLQLAGEPLASVSKFAFTMRYPGVGVGVGGGVVVADPTSLSEYSSTVSVPYILYEVE